MRIPIPFFASMYSYLCRHGGASDFVVTVHPKHERIYRLLGFEPFGPVKKITGVLGKPGRPLQGNLAGVQHFVERVGAERFVELARCEE